MVRRRGALRAPAACRARVEPVTGSGPTTGLSTAHSGAGEKVSEQRASISVNTSRKVMVQPSTGTGVTAAAGLKPRSTEGTSLRACARSHMSVPSHGSSEGPCAHRCIA